MRNANIYLIAFVITVFSENAFSDYSEPSTPKIHIIYGSGFDDATSVAPVGGNYHTTLGEQRKEVVKRAALIWAQEFDIIRDIHITANFFGLACDANGATLGSAGPSRSYLISEIWYPSALAKQVFDLVAMYPDSDIPDNDINVNLNSNVDLECLGAGTGWYYGLDQNAPDNTVDLLATTIHEYGHGLGFTSMTNSSGELSSGYVDIYSQHLHNQETNKDWTAMNDTERAAAMVSENLAWTGSNANNYAKTALTDGMTTTDDRIKLYSPSEYSSGSSVAHIDVSANPNQVMEPIATPDGLVLDIEPLLMKDIGWTLTSDSVQPVITVINRTINIDVNTTVQLTPIAATSSTVTSGGLYLYEFSTLPSSGSLDDQYSDSPTYTPNADFTGTDTVKFILYDDEFNLSSEGTFNIVISDPASDTNPIATDDNYSFDEDSSEQTLSVLDNDSDDNSLDTTSINIAAGFGGGTLVLSGADILFTPTADLNGTFTFTYTVDDDAAQTSNSATVTITLDPTDDAPVAITDSISLDEDDSGFTLDMISNDSDPDAGLDNDDIIIVGSPSSGSLNYSSSTYTYTPNLNFNGSDSFTYKLNDGFADSNTVTVTLTIDPVNDAPYCVTDGFTLNQNSSMDLYILSNDSDVESTVDFTMVNIDSDVSHGALVLTDSILTYTPDNNYFGSDSFTYYLNDGVDDGNTVTVNLTIDHVNQAPNVQNDSFTINEDTQIDLDVLSNDSDDVSIVSLSISTSPEYGEVSVNNDNTISYTPDENYYGNDSFTYNITDDENEVSSDATVSITIDSINDAPIANDDSYTISTDSINIYPLLNDFDEDINSIVITIDSQPSNGSVSVSGTNVTYQADENYIGLDSFTYYLTDTDNESSLSALVELDIRSEVTPVANALSFNLVEDSENNSLDLLTDNEFINSISEIIIITNPNHGELTVNATSVSYSPYENYAGADSFSYQLKDNESLLSNVETVTLDISQVNDAPIAMDDFASVTIDLSKNVYVLNNDWDEQSDNLTINIIDQPEFGEVSIVDNYITYNADKQLIAIEDEFTYQLTDSESLTSNIATVTMNITLTANIPTAYNDQYSVNENSSIVISPVVDDDYYTNDVTLNIISVENGSIITDGLSATFEPDTNFVGTASITYNITDDLNQTSNDAVVTVYVLANDITTVEQSKYTLLDTTLTFDLFANTSISSADSVDIIEYPIKGTLNIGNQTMSYVPDLNQTGNDDFSYILTQSNSNQVQVNVSVQLLNETDFYERVNSETITLSDDQFTVIEDLNLSLNVLFNDGLVDNSLYTLSIVQESTHGGVSVNNQSIIYSPNANYSGTDSFTYQVTNIETQSTSEPASVTLTINEVNDVPTSDDFTLSTGNSVTFDLFSNAVDVDGTLTGLNIIEAPRNGILILSGNQATYSKVSGFNGNDSFTYSIVDDQDGWSDEITVNISVQSEVNNSDSNSNDTVSVEVSSGSLSVYELLILFLLMLPILINKRKAIVIKNTPTDY